MPTYRVVFSTEHDAALVIEAPDPARALEIGWDRIEELPDVVYSDIAGGWSGECVWAPTSISEVDSDSQARMIASIPRRCYLDGITEVQDSTVIHTKITEPTAESLPSPSGVAPMWPARTSDGSPAFYPVPRHDHPDTTDQISDGYHTFGELYQHRAALMINLMMRYPRQSWYSLRHADGTMIDGFFIVGIDFPTVGQISYHLRIEPWYLCLQTMPVIQPRDRAPEWDGHTPHDVLARLTEWMMRPQPVDE